ncbi:MAG: hypothetical protein Q4P30_04570 [Eubacteriales bacterium]|nr:hypothetical protein [Eubacteriales bacterium]
MCGTSLSSVRCAAPSAMLPGRQGCGKRSTIPACAVASPPCGRYIHLNKHSRHIQAGFGMAAVFVEMDVAGMGCEMP